MRIKSLTLNSIIAATDKIQINKTVSIHFREKNNGRLSLNLFKYVRNFQKHLQTYFVHGTIICKTSSEFFSLLQALTHNKDKVNNLLW